MELEVIMSCEKQLLNYHSHVEYKKTKANKLVNPKKNNSRGWKIPEGEEKEKGQVENVTVERVVEL